MRLLFFCVFFLCLNNLLFAQNATKISALEEQKKQAVLNEDFKLANKLKNEIQLLKEKQKLEATQNTSPNKSLTLQKNNVTKVSDLEEQKKQAVANQNFKLANKLKNEIQLLKEKQKLEATQNTSPNKSLTLQKNNVTKVSALEEQKKQAVANQNFKLANKLKNEIQLLKEKQKLEATQNTSSNPPLTLQKNNVTKVSALEEQKKQAVANHDLKSANKLKKKIEFPKKKQENEPNNTDVILSSKKQPDLLKKPTESSNIKPAITKNKTVSPAPPAPNNNKEDIANLVKAKEQAIASKDYNRAGKTKKDIEDLKNGTGLTNDEKLKIKQLEKQKANAIATKDYNRAAEIKKDIENLKNGTGLTNDEKLKIKQLEKQKASAIASKDYNRAGKLKEEIEDLKNGTGLTNEEKLKIKQLEKEKASAIASKDYNRAGKLKEEIASIKSLTKLSADKKAELNYLENKKAEAIASKDYQKAAELKAKIEAIKYPNKKTAIAKSMYSGSESNIVGSTNARLEKSVDNTTAGIEYRRSSLYTLMLDKPDELHVNTIKETFINSPLPSKFNNHNLNGAIIPSTASIQNGSLHTINSYLETNQVAKQMIAKWFNRSEKGTFNMELIKSRGMYNASNLDLNIAQSSARGLALLSDAGEELIKNTYVVVTEFKYTNKEDVAEKVQKANRGFQIANTIASFIPGAEQLQSVMSVASTVSTLATAGATVAGKGYVVKVTSYLFKLVWDESVANYFYTNFYIDESSFDMDKKMAFDNSTNFKLQYVGLENTWVDLQSNIFTSKSEEELIAMATQKAIDKGIAKLQRKYEAFRTKTPLYSTSPLGAKIGLKEGLQAGDKYEVLEQVQTSSGKLEYRRKGIIKVKGSEIWDNTYTNEELESLGTPGYGDEFTVFTGGSNYAPGMLIRQVN